VLQTKLELCLANRGLFCHKEVHHFYHFWVKRHIAIDLILHSYEFTLLSTTWFSISVNILLLLRRVTQYLQSLIHRNDFNLEAHISIFSLQYK